MKHLLVATGIAVFLITGCIDKPSLAAETNPLGKESEMQTSNPVSGDKTNKEQISMPAQLSIFPGNPSAKIQGADGSEAKLNGDIIELRRSAPSKNTNLSKVWRMFNMKFAPDTLAIDKAPDAAALVIVFRRAAGEPAGKDNVITVKLDGVEKTQRAAVTLPFVDSGDWQELVLPLPGQNFPVRALFVQLVEGDYDLKEMVIRKPRNINIALASNPRDAVKGFTVEGKTDAPGNIKLCLTDPKGKKYYKAVKPVDGKFICTWDNPPLTPESDNALCAILDNGKDPMNVSLPINVYAYRDNYDYAWLKVDGRRIVTACDSKEFIPVGIGYARGVIIKPQDDAVMKFCKARSLNTIRLAFYTRYFNGDYSRPIDINEHIANHIEPVVDAARRHGMYVILDDHEYFHERIDEENARGKQNSRIWSEETVRKWIGSWQKVAEKYKDDAHVLGYELQNEPFDMDPETVRDFYTRCLKAIREIDKKHIILVGTNDWSHSRALEKTWGPVAATLDLPYSNIVFSFHDYPQDNNPWDVGKSVRAFCEKYNVPVMCTEFGATHWNKSETVCREFEAGMLALAAKESFGWMIWALGTLEDNPRNPYNEVDNIDGPPRKGDSCAYSDLWVPVARIMGTPFPTPPK